MTTDLVLKAPSKISTIGNAARRGMLMVILFFIWEPILAGAAQGAGLQVTNGWFVWNGKALWGHAQHNGWWRPGQRPNLARNAPGDIRPNRTEDFEGLTDNMLRYGYPGFEHNFGLWYDRRRDAHDLARRKDSGVRPPFLEQPWARGDAQGGVAWDGLPRYDLTRFNAWYFDRLREFAALCDGKGLVLIHNFYMQHALLETGAHYVDFPWRPVNCLQSTGLPDGLPAANVFYDVSHPERRRLHRLYIRKCLDELGGFQNVLFRISEEYTGPAAFARFWQEAIREWERESGRQVKLVLTGCKDVLDELLQDEQCRRDAVAIDLRYWWYGSDGKLFAPPGGREVAGRYASGAEAAQTTPEQIYRQVLEYRLKYPDLAILHAIEADRAQTWAFFMAGGSMLIRRFEYPGSGDPPEYGAPEHAAIGQPLYDFIRGPLSRRLLRMRPADLVEQGGRMGWCLADEGETCLVYTRRGVELTLDLRNWSGIFRAGWLDPRTGKYRAVPNLRIRGGDRVSLAAPVDGDEVLSLVREGESP